VNLISNTDTAFTADQRDELLGACLPAMVRRERVVEMVEAGDEGTRAALRPELDRLNEEIRNAWSEYQTALPILNLSRCPFTGEVWSHSIDPYGLDGFWWNHYKPVRLLHEPLGGRFFAFSGAVSAPTEMRPIPFLVVPGPDVPFLIDRLMQIPSVTAVISQIQIGGLDAYPIVYFTSADAGANQPMNDWGTDHYSFRGPQGHYEEGQFFDAEDEYRYNITPWVEQKRLQWIEPGDASLTLQSGTNGCMFLQRKGKNAVWRTKSGRLWWGPPGKT
jgi:hypothetical protein